jgi:hypothetical protein
MNVMHYMLAWLYLITMVLLPYGHMSQHGSAHTAISDDHGCAHAHHEPDSEPRHESGTENDCSICQLVLLPTEIPSLLTSVDTVFIPCERPEIAHTFIEASIIHDHRARAPPFMTV